MDRIICIAGPTASGKTALSIALAEEFGGEVVSCDSMQIYKGMDIGTAKPTLEERKGIPHYMLDVAEPWEDFSVSRYCEMATPIVEDILSRGKTAISAGGTGLYMDALIRGNTFAPYPSTGVREELEAQADREGIESILCKLKEVDPESAARLHLSDRKRIIRAMEVYLETGETITAHNERTKAILGSVEEGLKERGKKVIGHTPMGKFGQAQDMYGCVKFLLDERMSGFITGVTIPVDGGFLTLSGV